MAKSFDAIVVGARCAGSPTAMLLARKGYRVLLVDRASFPSDTVSTHILHPLGVGRASRDGDCSIASSRPDVRRCTPMPSISGPSRSRAPRASGDPIAYCPRRTILDKLLVDAAAEAGAEVREGFTVEEVLVEDGRADRNQGPVEARRLRQERAEVIVGADGRQSMVSEAVQARAVQREAAPAGRLLQLLERTADGRPDGELYPRQARDCGRPDPRRPDARHRRLAIRGIRGEQEGHRRQLPEDDRPGAGLRRTPAPRQPCGAVRRRGRAELFPQAIWPRLGAGRRRRLQQGLHHRARNSRCVPRRRALCDALERHSPERGHSTMRWAHISAHATTKCLRCTNSPASSRRSSRRHRSCNNCFGRYTETRRPWTDLRG